MSVSAEGDRMTTVRLRAEQPAGAVFALGWVMAELFDPRRRVSVVARQPPFDPDRQLPLATDLGADQRLLFLTADLAEYLHWFPKLARPLELVTRQVRRERAAVLAENLATAQEAQDAQKADDVAHAVAATTKLAGQRPFSETDFFDAVVTLHQAILDEFADDPPRLSAYQLGLALSDLAWLAFIATPGQETAASRPSALLGLFARGNLATVQTLLSGAGTQLPSGVSSIVSRSLENWADWLDVNSARIRTQGTDTWAGGAQVVLDALRMQGWVWRSALIADPEVAVTPSMGAWVQAGSAIARAAGKITEGILRRFWPLVILGLATLGGLLYLVISNLSGAEQVWASLVAIAAVLGSGGWGLSSALSQSFSSIGYDIWNAAKLDASAWNVTWLPAMAATAAERTRLEGRGVAAPQIRKNLDV
jgi:hypothetical protein